jgi:hypothetical protein
MRSHGFFLPIALLALVLAPAAARAKCSDDLTLVQERVNRELKLNPRPAGADAAAKVLSKFNQSGSRDEVDCYNAVARARRALMAAPADEPAALGQRQQPVQAQQLPGQPQQPLAQPPAPPDQVPRSR